MKRLKVNEKEIQEAAAQYKIPRDKATFEAGVQWALEQMKQSKERPYKVYEVTTEQNGGEYIGTALINAESVDRIDETSISINGLVTLDFLEPILDIQITHL